MSVSWESHGSAPADDASSSHDQDNGPDVNSQDHSHDTAFVQPRNLARHPSILPHPAFFSPATKRSTYDVGADQSRSPYGLPTPSSPLSPLNIFPEDGTDSSGASAPSALNTAPKSSVGSAVGDASTTSASHAFQPSLNTLSSTTDRTLLDNLDTRSREPLLTKTATASQQQSQRKRHSITLQHSAADGSRQLLKSHEKASRHQEASKISTTGQSSAMGIPPGHIRTGQRNYKHHAGSNRFLVNGLIMTANANPAWFLISVLVLLALGGLWLGFEAPYQWRYLSPSVVIVFAYLWAGTTVHMLVTAWRDPGVVPRDLDPEPLLAHPSGQVNPNPLDPEDPIYSPLPRVVRVRNGQDMTVKWCETCKVYRPPRSSHCRVCDSCVDSIDHHCTFLNTCIARRNYVSFFAFLHYAIATCCLGTILCALHLYWLTLPLGTPLPRGGAQAHGGGKDFQGALKESPMSAVLFLLILAVLGPLVTLTMYHIRLVLMNRTTVEQIRINTAQLHTYPRPSCMAKTFSAVCCGCCALGQSSTNGMIRLGDPEKDPNPFAHRNPLRNAATVLLRPSVSTVGLASFNRVSNRRGLRPGAAALDRRGYVWEDGRKHHMLDETKRTESSHVAVQDATKTGPSQVINGGANGNANTGGLAPAPPSTVKVESSSSAAQGSVGHSL